MTQNRQNLTIALFLLVFVPVVLFVALSLNKSRQQRILIEDTAEISREFSRHVGELQSLVYALAGMHQASRTDRSEALAGFAEQLRSSNPMITAIGLYQRLNLEDRQSFEQSMKDQGLFAYNVHDLQSDGSRFISPNRPVSYPVSGLDPMHLSLTDLMVSDLGANPAIKDELEKSARLYQEAIIRIPNGWPAAGQLMLFHPVYEGMYPPDEEEERVALFDGGFLAIVKPEFFSNFIGENLEKYSLQLDVQNSMGSNHVLTVDSSNENPALLSSWFRPVSDYRLVSMGTSKLVLSIKSSRGILPLYLVGTIIVLLFSAFCAVLAISHARNKARAQEQQDAGREALLAAKETALRTLNAISDAVVSIDANAKILHVNPAAVRFLENDEETLIGTSLDKVIQLHKPNNPSKTFNPAEALSKLPENGRVDLDLTPSSSNDAECVYRTTLTRDGARSTGILVLRDTSAEAKLHKALEHQANHDALTGCANRLHFESQMEQLIASDLDGEENHALLYMDLDNFKIINDSAGHTAGDKLLVELSQRLMKVTREQDILARIGGDEFALLIKDVNKAEATVLANDVFKLFQNMVFSETEHVFQIRASLGLVHFQEVNDTLYEILAAADLACYAAKDMGRNQLFVYSAEDEAIASKSRDLNWLQRLKRAMDEGFFELHLQPLYDMSAMQINHFEFLLRLPSDDGIEASPYRIIDAAERYGMMTDLDRWVIMHAFEIIAGLDKDNYADSVFGINISGQSAADSSLVEFLKEQFQLYSIDPALICFEITETAAIANFDNAVELAKAMRDLGCQLALDDFGSGLSSFGYLKNLSVDVLKIDGQFIKNIATNSVDRAMVKAICDVAASMELITVAEFVEDEASVSVLAEIGVDYAQGYHIGKPMTVADAMQHADEFNSGNPGIRKAA